MQHSDKWQEEVPLQPVEVEIVGWPVGGEYYHHSGLDESFEQSLENHCIGDIKNLELINKEKRCVEGKLITNDRYTVSDPSPHLFIDFMFHFVDL